MKTGARNLPSVGPAALIANPLILLTNLALLGGLSCYGIFTVLLVLALRDGELSVIYPVISLTYVWVAFLSMIFFHESMNVYKGCGIAIIVLGVTVLGRGGKR
jgi:drug/metabolite transporter (DMT)-like permease